MSCLKERHIRKVGLGKEGGGGGLIILFLFHQKELGEFIFVITEKPFNECYEKSCLIINRVDKGDFHFHGQAEDNLFSCMANQNISNPYPMI